MFHCIQHLILYTPIEMLVLLQHELFSCVFQDRFSIVNYLI